MEGTTKGPRMLWAFTLSMALTVSRGVNAGYVICQSQLQKTII